MLGASRVAEALAPSPAVSIAFWDGTRLIPSGSLKAGDPTLTRVLLKFSTNGRPGAIRSFLARFQVGANASRQSSFRFWVATGAPAARFEMPVRDSGDLGFTTEQDLGPAPFRLITGTGANGKLREGTYVIVPGIVDWKTFEYRPGEPIRLWNLGKPNSTQVFFLEVERA